MIQRIDVVLNDYDRMVEKVVIKKIGIKEYDSRTI